MAEHKPVYWRIGKGPWHEDPLTEYEDVNQPGAPLSDEDIARVVTTDYGLYSWCRGWDADRDALEPAVTIRRSAPPLRDQCKRCRAAKARAIGGKQDA